MIDTRIYKSNLLIESNSKLSLSEQRLLYLACAQIDVIVKKDITDEEFEKLKKEYEFKLIEIPIKEYMDTYKINDKNMYSEIKTVCDKFFDRSLLIKEDGKLIKKRWVITSIYDDTNGKIQLQFHPDLITDLLLFKNKYTILPFTMDEFVCKYTFKFNDLMVQYKKIGRRNISLEDLRFFLGVDESEYKMFSAFKRYVLDKAVSEVNNKTELDISYEIEKKGRKITGFNFAIKNKKVIQQSFNLDDNKYVADKKSIDAVKSIIKNKLPEEDYVALLKEANGDINKIKYQYEVIELQNINVENLTGRLLAGIKSGFKKPVRQKPRSNFNNFEHRDYEEFGGYQGLEYKLLGWDVEDDDSSDGS